MSTQMHVDAKGEYAQSTGTELEAIRQQRRAKGLPDDELSCRLDLVDRRIRQAYMVRRARGGKDPEGRKDVLSVFTAPEWTFKMPGSPLTPKQRERIVAHYRKLSKQHPGMLIVPGTIVTNTGTRQKPRIEAEAFVVHNGAVIKRTRKANEGFDTTGYTKADGSKVKAEDFHGLQKSGPGGSSMYEGDSSLFEFEGMKFSLEICADHGERRARQDVTRTGAGVDVQILVSDGATIGKSGLAAHEGGMVLTNDAKPFSDHASTVPGGIREVGRPGNYGPGRAPDVSDNSGVLLAGHPVEIVR